MGTSRDGSKSGSELRWNGSAKEGYDARKPASWSGSPRTDLRVEAALSKPRLTMVVESAASDHLTSQSDKDSHHTLRLKLDEDVDRKHPSILLDLHLVRGVQLTCRHIPTLSGKYA